MAASKQLVLEVDVLDTMEIEAVWIQLTLIRGQTILVLCCISGMKWLVPINTSPRKENW